LESRMKGPICPRCKEPLAKVPCTPVICCRLVPGLEALGPLSLAAIAYMKRDGQLAGKKTEGLAKNCRLLQTATGVTVQEGIR